MRLLHQLKFYLLTIIMMAFGANLFAQGGLKLSGDSLQRLITTTLYRESGRLFVHFDKTIYIPNETIWFNAYFLQAIDRPVKEDVLHVAIVSEFNRKLYVQKKFLITGHTAAGSIMVPDSIPEGDYSVVVYSNTLVKGIPKSMFTQSISVKHPPSETTSLPKPTNASKPIAQVTTKVNLNFYPEGGNLVANLPGYVGWEARDVFGKPASLNAVLLKDGLPIDTIETSAYGLGRFVLNPLLGSLYEAKIIGKAYEGKTILPKVHENGVTLSMPMSTSQDTVSLKVASTFPNTLHMVVHNGLKVFSVLTHTGVRTGRVFKISLNGVPKGLATITVFNKDLQPLAERIFYAHYDEPAPVEIVSDSDIYSKRQKVNLSLNLNSNIDSTTLISIAVVQRNRIDRRYYKDIENYQFIARDLSFLPSGIVGGQNTPQRKEYIEQVLLVRGWRKYVDTVGAQVMSPMTGVVTHLGRKIKKPLKLTLMGSSGVLFMDTDANGKFVLENEVLHVAEGRELAILATGEISDIARIKIDDPSIAANDLLAKQIDISNRGGIVDEKRDDSIFSFLQNKIVLKEVTIKGKNEEGEYHARPGMVRKNPCGDYICIFGGLNCVYQHISNKGIPVNGKFYIKHVGLRASGWIMANVPFQYQGCETKNKSVVRLSGIHSNREFYAYTDNDFEVGDMLYNSTLYWNPSVNLSNGKTTELSFYTGDIAGRFSIIIQGITDSGVVYAESSFEVRK